MASALMGMTALLLATAGLAAIPRTAPPEPTRTAVDYVGLTSQGRPVSVAIDRSRHAVTQLRFSIAYACSHHRTVHLRAVILRPDDAWAIVPRIPAPVSGFSEWFGGPIGHDFHVTGTLSSDGTTVTGSIHSQLVAGGRLGRCDSGAARYRAAQSAAQPAAPTPASITLTQYRRLPDGIALASAERRLGTPNDRDAYLPHRLISDALPSGVPGSQIVWLDYLWRGHPHRYFQFIFRAGRLLPYGPGRSILERG